MPKYAGIPYGGGLYGDGLVEPQLTLTRGLMIRPEIRVMFNGTIQTYQDRTFGFQQGTGYNLGLLEAISFQHDQKIETPDHPDFASSTLMEISTESLNFNLQIYEFDWENLMQLLPSKWDKFYFDNHFIATTGGYYGIDDADFKPLAIHFFGCSRGEVGDMSTIIRGGALTAYKVMLVNGLDLMNMTPRQNMTVNLQFQARRDLSRTPKDQLFGFSLF